MNWDFKSGFQLKLDETVIITSPNGLICYGKVIALGTFKTGKYTEGPDFLILPDASAGLVTAPITFEISGLEEIETYKTVSSDFCISESVVKDYSPGCGINVTWGSYALSTDYTITIHRVRSLKANILNTIKR